jgi:hypothetical protein
MDLGSHEEGVAASVDSMDLPDTSRKETPSL